MNKQEWLNACANEFRKYGCNEEESQYMAELCLDSIDGDLSYGPADCADEEVSYWSE